MPKNVYAFTAPGSSYPEYISVNQHADGGYDISVRSVRETSGAPGDTAMIHLTPEDAAKLAAAILNNETGTSV